mgnify:CR=1 FL=1
MYIGEKKIKNTETLKDKTLSGILLIEVEFEDKTKETFSKLLYDKIVSEKSCDATELREKRIKPIVEVILVLLRDWGIKLNELPYMSMVLNQSLMFNEKEALKKLWQKKYIPNLNSLEDVNLIAIDRVLKNE